MTSIRQPAQQVIAPLRCGGQGWGAQPAVCSAFCNSYQDSKAFNLPELQQFTKEFVDEAALRYQLPVQDPAPVPDLKRLQAGRLDPQLRGRVRLALQRYYMEWHDG